MNIKNVQRHLARQAMRMRQLARLFQANPATSSGYVGRTTLQPYILDLLTAAAEDVAAARRLAENKEDAVVLAELRDARERRQRRAHAYVSVEHNCRRHAPSLFRWLPRSRWLGSYATGFRLEERLP